MGGPDIPSAIIATALVSSMYYVGLQCLAERSHFKTGDMFLLLNSHLGDYQFRNNKEVEMAVGKLL
jgi:ribosome biogenesis protein Tsr3